MKTTESNGSNDYKYYPIEYTNMVFSTVETHRDEVPDSNGTWIMLTDKSKFLIGIASNILGSGIMGVISVGY